MFRLHCVPLNMTGEEVRQRAMPEVCCRQCRKLLFIGGKDLTGSLFDFYITPRYIHRTA